MTEQTYDIGFRSIIAEAVHEMMSGAHDAKVVSRETLQTFDESCFVSAQPSARPEAGGA
ncbi:hypothetical protein M9978_12780 [Sphingomonas sp. MG17]|uniref:Uncharacterized protein n=1 Tax=Sphingomonas tagetis TaxID=2949092 RepID=A0A9X2HI64_9SPHN|nr:hypothetical protein [Sphingomonas tagetis]MCP3731303.1 hypothetical protein [Sphingomonas tagetis]